MTTPPREAVNRMATRANHRGNGMRILLVEDEPAIQEVWADTLRDLGYAVDLAGTLSEAKDCFAAQVYDLVITEWLLPDGDGCVIAEWAAALGGKAVVTSGYLSYMPGGMALGHETLMKPVRLSDLVAAVEGLTGKVLADQSRGPNTPNGK